MTTDRFFADLDLVLAGFSEADRQRGFALAAELEALANAQPRLAERCYTYQARLLTRLREYEQALIAVEKALLLMPLDDSLLILKGDIFREYDEFSRALNEYTRVLRTRPDSVTALMRRAEMRQAQGQYHMALQDITEALRHEPRSMRLLYRRGLILGDIGRGAEAVNDFQTVARLSPDGELRRKAVERLRELGEWD